MIDPYIQSKDRLQSTSYNNERMLIDLNKPPSEPFLKSLDFIFGTDFSLWNDLSPREDFAQCMADTQKAKALLESHLDDKGKELFADFLHKKDQVYQSNDEKVFSDQRKTPCGKRLCDGGEDDGGGVARGLKPKK